MANAPTPAMSTATATAAAQLALPSLKVRHPLFLREQKAPFLGLAGGLLLPLLHYSKCPVVTSIDMALRSSSVSIEIATSLSCSGRSVKDLLDHLLISDLVADVLELIHYCGGAHRKILDTLPEL
jgi:hypothetical protein